MTDRELLEAAAKAAGYAVIGWDNALPDTPIVAGDRFGCGATVKWVWMPLCDDGDALRLAVKRDIRVGCDDTRAYCDWWAADGITLLDLQEPVVGGDKMAATRRAIVRAAAAAAMVQP